MATNYSASTNVHLSSFQFSSVINSSSLIEIPFTGIFEHSGVFLQSGFKEVKLLGQNAVFFFFFNTSLRTAKLCPKRVITNISSRQQCLN